MARRNGKAPVALLPDDETFVLARLWNAPNSDGGPITDRLIERKLVKREKDSRWHNLTPLGKRVRSAEFARRGGFGSLVTKFWGQELS